VTESQPQTAVEAQAADFPDLFTTCSHVPTEEQYLFCIRCGLCLSVCPTYRESLKETDSPRGRVALVRKAMEGAMPLSRNLAEQMYKCFACMACNAVCPVEIKPAHLALQTRHVAEQLRPRWWKRLLFHGLFARARRLELGTLPLRWIERVGLRALVQRLGLTKVLPAQLRDMERMLPRVPRQPLRVVVPEVTPAIGQRRRRVGFFLGCVQSLLFAEESAATVRVLARNGCEVVTPGDVRCCGMPPLGFGDRETAEHMARHNIELFERFDVDTIVTDCATCGSTLKEYVELLSSDAEWGERAARFSAKVRDISELLAEIPLVQPKGRVPLRVTYHDPCHLARAQNVRAQPRQLLQIIGGVEFVEMKESDWCCGSAGTQLITHYGTSRSVLDRKMDNVAATGADVVASGCPGCQMQLTVGIKRRGLAARVMHPIQLLDEAYRRGETDDAQDR
jgi:glycolate oxidase iron-sulfur subunit